MGRLGEEPWLWTQGCDLHQLPVLPREWYFCKVSRKADYNTLSKHPFYLEWHRAAVRRGPRGLPGCSFLRPTRMTETLKDVPVQERKPWACTQDSRVLYSLDKSSEPWTERGHSRAVLVEPQNPEIRQPCPLVSA